MAFETPIQVPPIVQLEFSKRVTREVSEAEADRVIAITQKCVVIPLGASVALLAAKLPQTNKLTAANAIVDATACKSAGALSTCNGHFRGLPIVMLFS